MVVKSTNMLISFPKRCASYLPKINLLVTAARSNNRLIGMKNTLINRSIVTGKLIQDAARSGIPDVNHSIRTTSCYLASIRRPTTLQQVLFKVVLVPFQHLHTPILWSIRTHIPNAKLAIHGRLDFLVLFPFEDEAQLSSRFRL